MPLNLSVVILTYNEALHIQRALVQLQGLVEAVYVIDSGSTDGTRELARAAGAVVLEHPFQNYARQFQWALEHAPIGTEWVMRLDADEIIEPDLAKELVAKLPKLSDKVTGIVLLRKTIFQNRRIRFGGRSTLALLRIWRHGSAQIEDRWMDEHMYLLRGHALTFTGGFSDHNLNDLTFFTDKHNKYASREALDVIGRRMRMFGPDDADTITLNLPARVKRWFKVEVYNRLPFELAATFLFFYRYILLLGFLDGRVGLTYQVLQCFWYRFLVGAKLRELEASIAELSDPKAIRAELEARTRMRIG